MTSHPPSISVRVVAVLLAAAFLATTLPVASAARAEVYEFPPGSIDVRTPVRGNNHAVYDVCPVGQPRPCALVTQGWNERFVDYEFTLDVGVDRVVIQTQADILHGFCTFWMTAPDGSLHGPRHDSWCRPWFQSNGKFPPGKYTLRIECGCSTGGWFALYDITYTAGYHAWDVGFIYRTSHALVPPRAESAQPRVCFDFIVNQPYTYLPTWYDRIHVEVDLGDGTRFSYEAKLPVSVMQRCHAYAVPVGVAVVCVKGTDGLGRTAQECRPVERGTSVS